MLPSRWSIRLAAGVAAAALASLSCSASSDNTSSGAAASTGNASGGANAGGASAAGGRSQSGGGQASGGGQSVGGASGSGGDATGGGGDGGAGGSVPVDCGAIDDGIGQCIVGGGSLASCAPGPQDAGYAAAQSCCAQGYLFCENNCPSQQALALTPYPSAQTAMVPAITGYNTACGSGGQWCSVGQVAAYQVASCTTPFRFDQLVSLANGQLQMQSSQVQSKAQLMVSTLFGTTYSSGGPALLSAADNAAASPWLLGWLGISEVPCPNCTDFDDRAILYYPTRGVVIVVDGGHGYDS